MTRNRWPAILRWTLRAMLAIALLLAVAGGTVYATARGALGAAPGGARLARMQQSPQWRDGTFRNRLPRVDAPMPRMLRAFLFGGSAHRVPDAPVPVPVVPRDAASFTVGPVSGVRATWFGHSTLLLELEGRRLLIDPVWGERVSPVSYLGPARFFAPPMPLTALPGIDAVVISHDHYDHLDTPTIRALAALELRFIVPLGVGAHLEAWGVAAERITELDWWEATEVAGLTVTATPARHFSGRSLTDASRTLWAGWAFAGDTRRVYYSGDTALGEFLREIGERLGPFDLTMIEVGAYDAMWADVHLGPEQAVLAHRLVQGDVMLPVHWGQFDLALHGWTEPMERVLVEAERAGVRVAAPRPGESVEPAMWMPPERWWPQVPWATVREAPAYSSGVDALLQGMPGRQ